MASLARAARDTKARELLMGSSRPSVWSAARQDARNIGEGRRLVDFHSYLLLRKGQLNRHTRYRPLPLPRYIAKGSVESTHKVPTIGQGVVAAAVQHNAQSLRTPKRGGRYRIALSQWTEAWPTQPAITQAVNRRGRGRDLTPLYSNPIVSIGPLFASAAAAAARTRARAAAPSLPQAAASPSSHVPYFACPPSSEPLSQPRAERAQGRLSECMSEWRYRAPLVGFRPAPPSRPGAQWCLPCASRDALHAAGGRG